MLRAVAGILSGLLLMGCAPKGLQVTPSINVDAALVIGVKAQNSMGSACAVAPTLALTVAHVVETKDAQVEWWSLAKKVNGRAKVQVLNLSRDAATITPADGVEFPAIVPIAKKPPQIGEEVRMLGVMDAYPTVFIGRVLGIDPSGELEIDGMVFPGTSGSCILNTKNELVGIVAGMEGNPGREAIVQRAWVYAIPAWNLVLNIPLPQRKENTPENAEPPSALPRMQ